VYPTRFRNWRTNSSAKAAGISIFDGHHGIWASIVESPYS
jgi:hypothetical protein